METSPAHEEHGLLARALDWIKTRSEWQQELGRLTRGDLVLMAADLGLPEADLRSMLPRAADNTVLMDGMLQARGLDPAQVRQHFAALMRELELACSRCHATGRCQRELQAGTAVARCHEFCLNADTMDELLEGGAAPGS